jgi:large subunit ribosomal protein L13e
VDFLLLNSKYLLLIKEAGVRRKEALKIGIAVDHRRRNKSVQGFSANVQRLLDYKEKLVVLKGKQVFQGEALKHNAGVAPVADSDVVRSEVGPATEAYKTLRKARSDKRLKGVRDARAKAKAEEEAQKKK